MSEVTVVGMPAMGDEGDSITLDRWMVQIGAHVQVGAPLCSVSIDKVDTEIPSPVEGYVTRFFARPHEGEISVGQPLLEIATELPASLDLAQVHRDQSLAATSLVIPAVLLDPMAQLPRQGSDLAAGWDLHAVEDVTLPSRGWGAVRTGVAIALPAGFEMQIRPRSGLAVRHGVTVLNAPGTIDADYRGELKVLLINHGAEDYAIRPGDRIAQAVVARHETLRFVCTDALPATDRGEGGFGHTGR